LSGAPPPPRRFAAIRGKITPIGADRRGDGDRDGTVARAHGSAIEEGKNMDERDQESPSAGHEMASEVSERIRAVIGSAEAAANAVRHEAEQKAAVKRRIAEEEAHRIVEDARREAEALIQERIRRISELSDAVVERGEQIVSRLDRAEEVRNQLQDLADALGESAEELARELSDGEGVAPREPAGADEEQVVDATVVEAVPEPAEEEPEADEDEASDAPVSEVADLDERRGDEAAGEEAGGAEARGAEAVGEEAVGEEAGDPEADDRLGIRLVALQMAVAGGNRGEVEEHLRRTFDVTDLGAILDDVFGQGSDDAKRVVWPSAGDGAA
jgi:hypothetical protein